MRATREGEEAAGRSDARCRKRGLKGCEGTRGRGRGGKGKGERVSLRCGPPAQGSKSAPSAALTEVGLPSLPLARPGPRPVRLSNGGGRSSLTRRLQDGLVDLGPLGRPAAVAAAAGRRRHSASGNDEVVHDLLAAGRVAHEDDGRLACEGRRERASDRVRSGRACGGQRGVRRRT